LWPNRRTRTYYYLPFAVFLYFALSFTLHPASPLHTGQLMDPDDYMRLNEVINWLQSAHPFGAGWFDMGHPRLDPGGHVIVHWARLVDLPIALTMLPFIHFVGMQDAALIASFIVPPLLFIPLLFLMPALARPLIGKSHNDLSTVFLLFSPAVLMNFLPGRVDHHAWQIIVAAFGILALQRIVLCPRGWKLSIAVAIAFACGLWIGTEALPWVILFCACLALLAGWRGGIALRNAAVFGIALPLAVAIIMPIALLPAEYTSHALSWFSGADLVFAVLAGTVFIGGWVVSRQTECRNLRLGLMGALGFFAGMLFIYFTPDILTGAYADYDTFFNDTLVNNIGEAQPLAAAMRIDIYNPSSILHAILLFLHHAFVPCVALLVIGWNLLRGSRRAKTIWLIHGFFLLPALLMTIFWQVRVGWFAQIFSIVPITWLALRLWQCIGVRLTERKRFWAEIAAFILIAPLPVVLVPAILGSAHVYPDFLLFPAARAPVGCPLLHASAFLNSKYGDHPRLILSGANEGPELLFRTKHKVIAAPYNVDGNRDAFDFFNARDDHAALALARRRHVDLVLVCQRIPLFYAGLESAKSRLNAHLYMDSRGLLHVTSSKDHPAMIERLINDDIPAWLNPVEIPLDPDYLLFEVNWVRD